MALSGDAKTKECTVEVNEVWSIDAVLSTGSGKPVEIDAKTTVYKRFDNVSYNLCCGLKSHSDECNRGRCTAILSEDEGFTSSAIRDRQQVCSSLIVSPYVIITQDGPLVRVVSLVSLSQFAVSTLTRRKSSLVSLRYFGSIFAF